MKTVIKALLAASMLMPVAAQAQEQDGRERGRGNRGEWNQRGPRAERSAEVGVQAQVRTERPQRSDFRPERAERPERADRTDAAPRFPQEAQRPDRPDRRAEDQPQRDGRWQNRAEVDGNVRNQRPDRGDRADRRDRDDTRAVFDAQSRDRQQRDARNQDWRGRDGQNRDWQGRTVQNRDWRGDDSRGWNGNRGWNDNRSGYGNRAGAWNRGWRNDNRYDWNRYRQANRGAYRLPRYYAPSGWGYGYRRFSVGVSLSSILFSQNYWIDDPFNYRLPEAYGPYRWVRYYDDALLVDVRSGQVVDTVYDIFF